MNILMLFFIFGCVCMLLAIFITVAWPITIDNVDTISYVILSLIATGTICINIGIIATVVYLLFFIH